MVSRTIVWRDIPRIEILYLGGRIEDGAYELLIAFAETRVDGVWVEELCVDYELREVVGVRGLVAVDALRNAVGEEPL